MLTVEVPEEVGVPLIRPAEEIDSPAGRPVAEKVGAGNPVAVTWKLSAKFAVKAALLALVIAGAWPTCRLSVLVSAAPTPLETAMASE